VSIGLWAGGRFAGKDLVPYIVAQVLGGIVAGFILLQIAQGNPNFLIDGSQAGAFASNGYGALSPGGYTVAAAFLCEVVLTAVFLVVIMGATHGRAPAGFAPIAIGLALTLIHLISIPVTNTSVNPARSTAVAVFAGSGALSQLWLFWVAPILGAMIGGIAYKWIGNDK
jgi:aquaporin Z